MPEEEKILSEKDRVKLDGIVVEMTTNNESDEDIQFVVNDFKEKYGVKKNGGPSGSSGSGIPFISPKTQTDPLVPFQTPEAPAPTEQVDNTKPIKINTESGDFIRPEAPPDPLKDPTAKTMAERGEVVIEDKEGKINAFLEMQAEGDPNKMEILQKQRKNYTQQQEYNAIASYNITKANTMATDLIRLENRKQELGDNPEAIMEIEGMQQAVVQEYEALAKEQNELIKQYPEVYDEWVKQKNLNGQYEMMKKAGGLPKAFAIAVKSGEMVLNVATKTTADVLKLYSNINPQMMVGAQDKFIEKAAEDLMIRVPAGKIYDSKTKKYDAAEVIPFVAEQLAVMGTLIGGGAALGGGASGIVKAAFLTQLEPTKAMVRELEPTLSEAEVMLYAVPVTLGQAWLERVMPDNQLVFGSRKMLKDFVVDLAKGGNVAIKSIQEQFINVAKEMGEEYAQSLFQNLSNYASNATLGTDLETITSTEENVNTGLITMGVSFLAGAGNLKVNSQKEINRQIAILANQPEAAEAEIQEQVELGVLSLEKANTILTEVKKYAEVIKKMPPDLTVDQQVEISPLAVEREELVEKNKEVLKPLQVINQEKIEKLDTEILKAVRPDLVEETKPEKSPAAEKAPAPEPVQTETTDGKVNEKRGQEGRKDVLKDEQAPETVPASVSSTVDAAIADPAALPFIEKDGVGLELQKNKDGVRIESLTSKEKGKGNASKVLKELTKDADAKGIPVYLDADAKKGGMSQEELVKFYKRNGFVFEEGSTQGVRPPAPKLTEEQKQSTNKEAEALGWENVPQALNSIAKRTGQYYTSWDQVPAEVREAVSAERQTETQTKTPPVLSEPLVKPSIQSAKERLQAAKKKAGLKLGIAADPKQRAKDLYELHSAYVGLAKEYIKEGIKTGKEFADAIGEKFTKRVKDAWLEAKGKTIKTEADFEDAAEPKKRKKTSRPAGAPPKNPPSDKEEKSKEPGEGKRRFTQQVINDKKIPDVMKDMITDGQISYKKAPNAVTLQEANEILEYLGDDAAIRAFMDFKNGLTVPVRYTIGQILIKKLSDNEEYEKAIDVLDRLTKSATELGQGIQALSMYANLGPGGQLMKAQREINQQREKRETRDRKKIDKIKKAMEKANAEAIDEVLKGKTVKKKTEKAQTITEPEPPKAGYGKSNKVVTTEKYKAVRARLRNNLFTNPVNADVVLIAAYHLEASGRKFSDFAKNMVRDLGTKVRPYLKQIYDEAKKQLGEEYDDFDPDNVVSEAAAKLNTDNLVKKMEAALAKGQAKEISKALAALQQASKNEGLWGKYKAMAISRLKGMNLSDVESDIKDSPILEEFTNGLVKNIRQQVEVEKETTAKKPKSAIEIIADAYKNFEKYEKVWEQTQEEIMEKYKDDPEILQKLDEYFGEITLQPFSEKLIQSSVKEGMKDLGQDIAEIVKSHYTVYDGAQQALVDKLINQAGLDPKRAAELEAEIRKEFDRVATAKKKAILDKMFSPKERKKPEVKTLEGELIKLTNLGAFSDPMILKQWAESMGYPKLTDGHVAKIRELSEKVQKSPDGIKKFRAIEDLLTYQQKIKGNSWWDISLAVWYANILSGPTTQLVNFAGNMYNTAFLGLNAGLQGLTHGSKGLSIAKGFWVGLQQGFTEGKEVLRTGYNPIRENKVEVPPILELTTFSFKPANYLKYVRRFMVAADTLFFEAQKEMRAYQLASKIAREEGKLDPTINQKNRALEILNKTDTLIQAAQEKAQAEFESEVEKINAMPVQNDVKKDLTDQAKRDIRRRVQEIVEKGRGQSIISQSHSFAARGTFNYPPQGVLGKIAHGINQFTSTEHGSFFKLIMPFTNIISNVVNETINYTPLGHLRAQRGGTISGFRRDAEFTEQDKVDLHVKALIGTASFVALAMLALPGDDEEEPWVEITANGYGDYQKNYDLGENEGWQAYSMRFKNPLTGEYGPWISYKYLPINAVCMLVGNMADAKKYKGYEDKDIIALTSFSAGETVMSLFDNTALSSVNTTLNAAMNMKNGEKAMEAMVKQFGRTAKSFVVPNLFNQTSKEVQRIWDLPIKETSTNTPGIPGVIEMMVGEVLRDLPVARDRYYNKVNGLGEEISPDTDRLISFGKPHKEFNLLQKKGATTDLQSIKATTVIDNNFQERAVTQEEYYIYAKTRGTLMKQELNRQFARFEKMPPEEFKKHWSDIKSWATSAAKEKAVNPNYNLGPRKERKHLTEKQRIAKMKKEKRKKNK